MEKYKEGSEGRVYFKDGYAYKYFKDEKVLASKQAKVEEFKKINLEGFVMPEEALYDENNNFNGYIMKQVNNDLSIYDLCEAKKEVYKLDKKIEYLLKAEKLIKKAHEKGFILNDCNLWNFLIQENDEVIGIDTDNFQYKNLKTETIPTYFLKYYQSLANQTESSVNSDKFSFGLLALRSLLKYPFELNGALIEYNSKFDYLQNIFKYIDMPKEALDEIYEFLSTNEEKEWIGKTLVKLSSNSRKFLQ